MYNIYDIFESYKFNRLLDHDFNRIEEYINNFSIYNNHVVMEGYLDDLLDFSPVYEGIGDVVNKVVEFIKACWKKIKEWLDKVFGLFRKREGSVAELDKQIQETNKQGEQKVKNGDEPKSSEKEEKDEEKKEEKDEEKKEEKEDEEDVEDLSKPEKEEKKKDEDEPKNKKEIDLGEGEKFSYKGKINNNNVGGVGNRKLDYVNKEFGLINGIKLDLSKFQQKCASTKEVLENCKLELEIYEFIELNKFKETAEKFLDNIDGSIYSATNGVVTYARGSVSYVIKQIKEREFGYKDEKDFNIISWVDGQLGVDNKKVKKKVKDISQNILDIIENTSAISNMIKMLKQQGEQKVNQLIKLAEKRKGAKNEDLQNVGHVMESSAKFIMTLLGNGFKAILNKLNRQQSMCYAIAKRASAEYHSAVLK